MRPMADEAHWSMAWADRPAEEARIFNPAFCGELIGRTVCEYHRTRRASLGLAVTFLILPMTLHKQTREALPGRANTAFAGWVAENASLLAELPDRVRRLRSVSREALIFSIRHQLLAITGGGITPGPKPVRLNYRPSPFTDDVNAARLAAGLLGRWFAAQAAQISILQGMGIAP